MGCGALGPGSVVVEVGNARTASPARPVLIMRQMMTRGAQPPAAASGDDGATRRSTRVSQTSGARPDEHGAPDPAANSGEDQDDREALAAANLLVLPISSTSLGASACSSSGGR